MTSLQLNIQSPKLQRHNREHPRIFVTPNLDSIGIGPIPTISKRSTLQKVPKARKRMTKMRYAAYIRTSGDDQIGNYSLDAQQREIETWVASKQGILVKIYEDEAKTARTADRPAFQKMRNDARKGKFDALVVHKFDRFARNRTDALAIKSLLRYDYGVKVYSVTEPSEDSEGPMGALIEGVMESVADWYSRNLATEVAKGKKERSHQGLHNNKAPFGMKKNDDLILVPDENELPGLIMAFEHYATGNFSDNDIAQLLNKSGYRSKTGRPFSKDTVRDILQNQTYLGKVKYQKYTRTSKGRRSYSAPVRWSDGQHQSVIEESLFEACLAVRASRRKHRQATERYNFYLLRNMVYCHRCLTNPPKDKTFKFYGKMRCQAQRDGKNRYYRCRAKQLGYSCSQVAVDVETIDSQVLAALMSLESPEDWRKGVSKAVGDILGDDKLDERVESLKNTINRMDMRWDNGFFTSEQDYIERRVALQNELEQLSPVPDDELERAAEFLRNFKTYWQDLEGNPESQRDLLLQIVDRVYVDGDMVVAMTLKSNFHLVLGNKANGPTPHEVDPFVYTYGSDGI